MRVQQRRAFSKLAAVLFSALGLASPSPAAAFTHIVQPAETLASISERFYGKIQNETLLVVANALDSQGGIPIVPGMRLEVPALTYVRIGKGQTWKELALKYLGAEHRMHVLAEANDSKAWLPPEPNAEVVIPYNLRFIATGNDTVVGLAYRFLGDRKRAWQLDQYNARGGRRLERGEIVLLPIVDVTLTAEGKRAAEQSIELSLKQTTGEARSAQQRVARELPALLEDIRHARYIQAVERANRFLESGELSQSQNARIQRLLLEAHAALGSVGRASEACGAWFRFDDQAKLDPVLMSPKLIAACEGAGITPPTPSAKATAGAHTAGEGSDPK